MNTTLATPITIAPVAAPSGAPLRPLPDLRAAVILAVDDEQPNLDLLEGCLLGEGYSAVHCLRDSASVLDAYDRLRPDLILLDLHMPAPDGFEVLRLLGDRVPAEEYLPILVLTADATEATKQRALSTGARDFLTKPLNLTEVGLRISNLLQTRSLHLQQREARRRAEAASLRASVLADASQALAASFDMHTGLAALCRSAVPRVADWCVVEIAREDGRMRRAGAACLPSFPRTRESSVVRPEPENLLGEGEHTELNQLPKSHPLYIALTEGQATIAADIPADLADGMVPAGLPADAGDRLRPRALIAAPLVTSGRVRGALLLAQTEPGRSFSADDLELATELARRAATTIENAQLYNQALEATKSRDELLAVVAHDLRNPLSTIKMGSVMLRDDAASESHRKSADLVVRAADRMNKLIEDLLDVSRIERGSLRVELKPGKPGLVVKEAVALLEPLAKGKNLELSARVADDLPLAMMDGARVLQVLSNLVGNALKFTPPGGRIEIACDHTDSEVLFTVSDTGPGIPPDQIPHIFGRFWQASDRDTRGIGLGLSIVRGIVQTHGGRVWVESEVGRGSRFYFTLGRSTAKDS